MNTEIRRRGTCGAHVVKRHPHHPLERGEAIDETGTTQVFLGGPRDLQETVEFDFETPASALPADGVQGLRITP